MSHRHILVQLFNEQSGICPYCQNEMTLERDKPNSATIEHILPKSKGGPDIKDNFMAACATCNHARGNMPLGEFLISIFRAANDNKPLAERRAAAQPGLRFA